MRPLEPGTGGVLAVIGRPGERRPVAECASCGRVMILRGRGLCGGCTTRHRKAATLSQYGWVKADRLAEYAALRNDLGMAEAAARVGVTKRTAHRYEAALREVRAS